MPNDPMPAGEGIELVHVAQCVHYRSWSFAPNHPHMYADYIRGLATGKPIRELRKQFVDRIFGTRAVDMGAILGIELTRACPAWIYPWNLNAAYRSARLFGARENPDIVCHTSSEGVLASHLNREFRWLESSFESMKSGYLPEEHGFITLLRLRDEERSSYLVLDGNHRLAALGALGHTTVRARVVQKFWIRRKASWIWPGIVCGRFTRHDAEQIFAAYFRDGLQTIPESSNWSVLPDEHLELTPV